MLHDHLRFGLYIYIINYKLWIMDANSFKHFDGNEIDLILSLKMIIIISTGRFFHHFPFYYLDQMFYVFQTIDYLPTFLFDLLIIKPLYQFSQCRSIWIKYKFQAHFFIFSFNNFIFVTIFIQFLLYVMLCSAHTEIQFCSFGYFSLLILWLIVVDVDLYFIVLK